MSDIKSNNPHLTGGEKQQIQVKDPTRMSRWKLGSMVRINGLVAPTYNWINWNILGL